MRSRRIALDQALDGIEQVGPHRLRAQIAAPDPPAHRVHQEQGDGGEDQTASEVIDLLRPQLDEEEVEAMIRQIQAGRARRGRVPPDERQEVVDAAGRTPSAPI